jgi:Aspartyl protease
LFATTEGLKYPSRLTYTAPNFVLLFCLVDSGASDIILNAQFASLLGIDLTAAPSQEYQGIGDEPFQAYKHRINIRLQAASEAFTVSCAFMPDLRIDCILGQNGFFDTHKIVFEKYKKRFAITPVMQRKKYSHHG